ncbi:MAG: hypothetical protein HZB53_10270 [Chloroflexi bacterium]|nr:hypothetical protein [Chloroflexota bacterium]
MDDYPIQGKLRMRADNYERDRAYIEPRVGKLSAGELKGMPGFEFLKFYYVDFAATPAQWAEIQLEMDRRNILVTLYEAPVFYMESLEEEGQAEEGVHERPQTPRLTQVATGVAILIVLAGLVLAVYTGLDMGACIVLGVLAALVGAAGQIYAVVRARRGKQKPQQPDLY